MATELRPLIDLQLEQLRITRDQAKAAAEHNAKLLQHHLKMFEYIKDHNEAVLRKQKYDVPPEKLVVVVADFSSGDPAKGREIADEIAAHLRQLKDDGIDVHVLVGEIKPGVVIRSEEMALEVGKHFPPQTNYVVLWGSMSELTVGRFRPQVTCACKRTEEKGIGTSYTIDLSPEELPLGNGQLRDQRKEYERLVGVACAVVPKCYAAFLIGREQSPDLRKLYQFLGADSAETKALQQELAPLLKWTDIRPEFVYRLSDITDKDIYPRTVRNNRDDTVMVLVMDRDDRPYLFGDEGKKHIAYIDTTEVSIGQYATFLNKEGNKSDGGVQYYIVDQDPDWQVLSPNQDNKFVCPFKPHYVHAPIVNVSYFGARAYCKWAGKELPHQEEWIAAATSGSGEPYPWGKDPDLKAANWNKEGYGRPSGTHPRDKSRIGCFDMAGNVAEWCDDLVDPQKGERIVCGASYKDTDAKYLQAAQSRKMPQISHTRWIGFRGILRVPIKEQ